MGLLMTHHGKTKTICLSVVFLFMTSASVTLNAQELKATVEKTSGYFGDVYIEFPKENSRFVEYDGDPGWSEIYIREKFGTKSQRIRSIGLYVGNLDPNAKVNNFNKWGAKNAIVLSVVANEYLGMDEFFANRFAQMKDEMHLAPQRTFAGLQEWDTSSDTFDAFPPALKRRAYSVYVPLNERNKFSTFIKCNKRSVLYKVERCDHVFRWRGVARVQFSYSTEHLEKWKSLQTTASEYLDLASKK